MRKINYFAALAAITASLALFSPATGHGAVGGTPMEEFKASQSKMDNQMMQASGATTDAAFVRKMIVHHQGAIDMAQVELRHGNDSEGKAMAQKTLDENMKV